MKCISMFREIYSVRAGLRRFPIHMSICGRSNGPVTELSWQRVARDHAGTAEERNGEMECH